MASYDTSMLHMMQILFKKRSREDFLPVGLVIVNMPPYQNYNKTKSNVFLILTSSPDSSGQGALSSENPTQYSCHSPEPY